MRHTLVNVGLVTLLAGLAGPVACAHWVPLNDQPTQAEVDPASAYAAVLKVTKDRGYAILEQKDAERSVKLRAHVDEKRSDRASYITAQVDASGHVRLTPSGFLVRDNNKVHSKLASEITYFNDALQGELKHAPPLASASASALPPPPEPPPPAETASAPAPTPPAPPKPASAAKPASTATGKAPATPKAKPKSGDDWETVK